MTIEKNKEEQYVPIVCPICGVGCNTELLMNNGKPIKIVVKGRNPDLNDKFICIKGLIVADILNHKDRLKTPLHKEGEDFKKISWEEAIKLAAERLYEIIERYGPNSIGILASGKILNEEAYLAQKFARTVIKTHNIDICARLCHSPSEIALRMQFGYGAVSACINDFTEAEVIILIGANTRFTHPGVWNKLRKTKKKLIVADIFEALSMADIKLRPNPGTDLVWINGLSKIIVNRDLYDHEFIEKRTIGFAGLKKSLSVYTKEFVEKTTNISTDQLNSIADLITNKKTIFIWGMGLTQHAHGTDAVLSIGNLALLTGNIGKRGTGIVPLRGQNNVQGASDMGCSPFTLPGGYDTTDKGIITHFEGYWNTSLPKELGLSTTEMIHKILDGKVKALYIIGENPVLSEPQSAFVKWMLRNLELLIVEDIFLTETAKYAHIVFPAAALGEKYGTVTNAHRRIQYTEKAVNPPQFAKPDWQILQDLANSMGQNWNYKSAEEIWNEIRNIVPIFKGATYSHLKNSYGLFWPIYNENDEGSRRLYLDRFSFKDGMARFYPIKPPSSYTKSTSDFPYMLVTHRLYEQFNTGEMTLRSKITSKDIKNGFVALNESDANLLHLTDGSFIRINSPYGSVVSPIKIIKGMKVPKGFIFAPIHFFKFINFNELTSTYPLDPLARMPSLKKIPVNIEKV